MRRVPPWLWLIALAAVLIRAPVLGAGFVSDDYVLLAGIEGRSPLANTPLNLWTFYTGVPADNAALVRGGALPWWTAPTARHAFLRPLSSALLVLTHAVSRLHAAPYHALDLALCALNVLLVGLLFRKLLPARAAPIALVVFAVHVVHAGAALWISAIHIPLATAFGLAGLLSYVRWRSDGWRPGRVLAVLAFVLALAAGEAGLLPLAYVVGYELASGATPRAGRVRALAPVVALAVAYVALYRVLGFGARAIGGYLDLAAGPGRLLPEVGARLERLLPHLVTAPSAALLDVPGTRFAQGVAWLVGAFVVLLAVVVLAMDRTTRRACAWWVGCAVLAAVPAVLGPSDRALYASTIGSSAALGILLASASELASGRDRTALVRGLAVVAGAVALLANVVLAGATSFDAASATVPTSEDQLRAVSALAVPAPASTDVVVLLADGQPTGPWGGVLRRFATGRSPASWQALSITPDPHRLLRTADDTFVLEPGRPGGFSMHVYRDAAVSPMRAGDRVATPGLSIQVLDAHDGVPLRIRVHASRSFDDPRWCFAARWQGKLVRVRLPPVGKGAVFL